MRDLLQNYNRRVRPSLNASEPLNVTFGLALAQIIDVVRHPFVYMSDYTRYVVCPSYSVAIAHLLHIFLTVGANSSSEMSLI